MREEMLDQIAAAIAHIARALAALGDAYEQVDEQSADRLEAELFRPVQSAYGRAKRTHTEFAQRHDIPVKTFPAAQSGAVAQPAGLLATAVEEIAAADETLADLQDSMAPVEYGDADLRAGLAEVRRSLDDADRRARAFTRVLGR